MDAISLAIYVALAVAVVGVMLLSAFLGPRHSDRATATPFESGILVTGSARRRFPAHFYLIGMFFVVFDIESIFLYAWSINIRELGLLGLAQIGVFIFVLIASLLYLLRTGGLHLGPRNRRP